MRKCSRSLRVPVLLAMVLALPGCGSNESTTSTNSTGPTGANGDQSAPQQSELTMSVQKEPLGLSPDGQPIEQFLLTNTHGMTVAVMNYGAIVRSVFVPDRDGHLDNVNLGFANYEDYFNPGPYFGAICGRYANRIAQGKFTLDGQEYSLAVNNPPNHLHGGERGFDKATWIAETVKAEGSVGVKMIHVSKDGDEGYPGNMTVTVTYSLTDENELRIDYQVTTDKASPLNITSHCYWNLAGTGADTKKVLDHELMLNCDRYLPVDETSIPTGELAPVADTPMDFRTAQPIGSRIADVGMGYDHCYVINGEAGELRLAAQVYDPSSGRALEIMTTEPGVQLYTGNYLDGSPTTAGFEQHEAFCLECQHFPDSPNQPDFPMSILEPGEVYRQTTVHKFFVK